MAVAAAVATGVAAAVAAGAAVVAVEAAGGKHFSDGGTTMKSKLTPVMISKILGSAILILCCLQVALNAAPAAKQETPAATTTAAQKEFSTPKEAADSLVQAAETFDAPALKTILGPGSEDLVSSDDPVQDKNRAVAFAAKAKEKMSIEADAADKNRNIITIGNDDFPVPIPLIKQKGKWIFDAKSGRQEILNRRVGANELDAIAVCRGFVEAQGEYSQEKHDDAKVNQYAQRIISTPGKHDGLAWKNADGTWGGSVGEAVAKAIEQGYTDKTQPFHGYYFKVLKGQGPAAPKGEMDFVVDGAMIGGFALAAAPAEYRVTGVQTFIVGPEGVVFQKDLGPDTLKAFKEMERFNPDKTWHGTDDEWQDEEEDEGGE